MGRGTGFPKPRKNPSKGGWGTAGTLPSSWPPPLPLLPGGPGASPARPLHAGVVPAHCEEGFWLPWTNPYCLNPAVLSPGSQTSCSLGCCSPPAAQLCQAHPLLWTRRPQTADYYVEQNFPEHWEIMGSNYSTEQNRKQLKMDVLICSRRLTPGPSLKSSLW